MKLFTPFFFFLFSFAIRHAAAIDNKAFYPSTIKKDSTLTNDNKKDDPEKPRILYIGLGTGYNNSSGVIGPNIELRLFKHFSVFGAGGFCAWGVKGTGGLRYYFSFPKKAAFGLSYSYCSGVGYFTSNMFVIDQTTKREIRKDVTMKLNAAPTVNLTFLYFWKIGKHNRVNIETGYAFSLRDVDYILKSDVVLSSSSKSVLHDIHPGGLILGASFIFGIR